MSKIPEFGIKRENEVRRDGGCAVIFDPKTKKFAVGREEKGRIRLFSGGVDPNEDIEEGVLREIKEESGLYDFEHIEKLAEAFAHFHNWLKNVNRYCLTTCFLVILKSTNLTLTKLEAHERFYLDWVTVDELKANWKIHNKEKNLDHWLYFLDKAQDRLNALGY